MPGTFISYRREDAAGYAGRLRESLERHLGTERVFRDVDALQPGQDFVKAIEARLASCGVMLVVIGREWLDAKSATGTRRLDDPYDFVRLEVAAGINRTDVLVVPVLVEGAPMPAAADLPADIRPLARRHAVSVRDETWDTDVERLVEVINAIEHGAPATAPMRRGARRMNATWLLGGGALLALLVLSLVLWRTSAPRRQARARTEAPAASTAGLVERTAAPYAIDVPRVAEAAFGEVVYTLVSGSVVSRSATRELRLRMRLSNNSSFATNLWDRSFRLQAGGEERAPTSDLNDVVPAHALAYGIVAFPLPDSARKVVLRLVDRGGTAEIPLDVTTTGRAPADEQAEVPDSLSQAIVRTLARGPDPLITTPELAVILERVAVRRFVNSSRIRLNVRVNNRGQGTISQTEIVLRVAAGDAVVAPLDAPGDLITGRSSALMTVAFDVPPTTSRVVLRSNYRDRSVDHPLDLP